MTWVAASVATAEAIAVAEALAVAEAAAAAAAAAEAAAVTATAAEAATAGITAAEAATAAETAAAAAETATAAETGAQGIMQAAPEVTNVAAEGSNVAAEKMQEEAVKQGLEQAAKPDQAMFEEMQRQMAEQGINQPPVNQPPPNVGNQLASNNSGITSDVGGNPTYEAWQNTINSNTANGTTPELPQLSPEILEASGNGPVPSLVQEANTIVPESNPFMDAYSKASKFVETYPKTSIVGGYGLLSASGALNQKGDAPPPKKTFSNPYRFSPDFQGTYPNPNDYQYTPKYPSYAMGGIAGMIEQLTGKSQKTSNAASLSPNFKRGEVDPNDYQYTPKYAMGGITGVPPQTNFANPSQSMMGTSQYDMPIDSMSGNIANRMAEGGVTGSGQMQLNVPLSVGGAGGGGGGGGGLGGGGGYGGYDGTGGPGASLNGFDNGTFGPNVNNFGGGGGYAPPGGPQMQRGIGGKGMMENQRMQVDAAMPQITQPQYLPDIVRHDIQPPEQQQRGIGGKGASPMQRGIGFAQGGIASYRSGGKMDVYDASLRFADMMDNPNRYTPPDTRFQSVDTFRDTNPNTSTKSPDEAAEIRRKAIEQRSYVNTGAKYLPPSRRPGQLDLGPVSGERSKYDNQESILAAQGGIMGYNLGGYANGGNPRLLKGPGDGMSDNIPATIANRQPARLADGEFVVPADVVSHLGNGSTEAGAKKLHEMMNSVRKARTGNPKQGKKINPSKFMPKK